MSRSRLLRAACLAAALVVLPIDAARACSCADGDPRDTLAGADGAIIGTFIESHDADGDPDGWSDQDWIYTFRVDEEVKGDFQETLEVHSARDGASCGLGVRSGGRYGLFLYQRARDGAWTSGLCSQTTPEEMREAASPLPAPTSSGPVRFVVGGSFGKAQTMALDERGDIVGYGFGDRDMTLVDACPGGRRIAEIGSRYPRAPRLVVRRLRDFEPLWIHKLPFGWGQRFPGQYPVKMLCRSRWAQRVVVFSTNHGEPEARSRLTEVTPDGRRLIRAGSGTYAAFHAGRAFITSGARGRDLLSVSLRTGRSRSIGRAPGFYAGDIAISPNGATLAGLSHPTYGYEDQKPNRLYTLDLTQRTPTRKVRDLNKNPDTYGELEWFGDRRIVHVPDYYGRSHVYDLRLMRKGTFELAGHSPVVVGERVYSLGYGVIRTALLPDGPARRFRLLPSPVTYALEAVTQS